MQSGGPAVQFEELKCGFVFKVEAWESWSPKLFCPLLPFTALPPGAEAGWPNHFPAPHMCQVSELKFKA